MSQAGHIPEYPKPVHLYGSSADTLRYNVACSNLRTNREENAMSGWAWMAIGATVLAVVIMQIAMRIK